MKTVRVYSANPKTADGYNTFIFRRDVARSLNKLAWAPVIDARQNRIPVGIELSDERVQYSREQKKALALFLAEQLRTQYGPVDNDDFGRFGLQRLFVKEVQRHALATRREYVSTLSARSVASGMVHFAAAPNEEIVRRNGIRYFEYGLAKVRMDDGLYLIMGEVGVRSGSSPYYDQHVVAKFKADSEVSSLQGHIRIGESAFERIYDSSFRLILQGVELYYNSNQTIRRSPRFSIIIPVYNVAPYLRECLESVLAQTFTDWEAICVDDGSTDGGGEILDAYMAKDGRFKVFHQENQGVAATRQIALERCRGEWVVWADADDWVGEAWLSAFDAVLKERPIDMALCGCWMDGKDGPLRYDEDCADDADGLMKALLDDRACGFLFTKAFSRKFILEHDIRFPPRGCDLAEDLVFCCRFLLYKPSVKWSDGCHYHYRMREASLTHTQRSAKPYVDFARTMAFLSQRLLGTAYEQYADLIKQRAKFRLYDQSAVSNEVFAQTLPEVCDIDRLAVGWWHRILFRIAVRGHRKLAIGILRLARVLRLSSGNLKDR